MPFLFRKLSSCTAALTSALLQAIYPIMLSSGDWFESIARINWHMDMHTIVDDLYERATEFMHKSGLYMDEDFVGK